MGGIDESLIHAIVIAQDAPGSLREMFEEYVKMGKNSTFDEMEFYEKVEEIWRMRRPDCLLKRDIKFDITSISTIQSNDVIDQLHKMIELKDQIISEKNHFLLTKDLRIKELASKNIELVSENSMIRKSVTKSKNEQKTCEMEKRIGEWKERTSEQRKKHSKEIRDLRAILKEKEGAMTKMSRKLEIAEAKYWKEKNGHLTSRDTKRPVLFQEVGECIIQKKISQFEKKINIQNSQIEQYKEDLKRAKRQMKADNGLRMKYDLLLNHAGAHESFDVLWKEESKKREKSEGELKKMQKRLKIQREKARKFRKSAEQKMKLNSLLIEKLTKLEKKEGGKQRIKDYHLQNQYNELKMLIRESVQKLELDE